MLPSRMQEPLQLFALSNLQRHMLGTKSSNSENLKDGRSRREMGNNSKSNTDSKQSVYFNQ